MTGKESLTSAVCVDDFAFFENRRKIEPPGSISFALVRGPLRFSLTLQGALGVRARVTLPSTVLDQVPDTRRAAFPAVQGDFESVCTVLGGSYA